jgi:hypothetical protein
MAFFEVVPLMNSPLGIKAILLGICFEAGATLLICSLSSCFFFISSELAGTNKKTNRKGN